jgi:Carboxypeptidase regulatory-like domain
MFLRDTQSMAHSFEQQLIRLVCAFLLLGLTLQNAESQVLRQIQGTITDFTGAAIPNARITLVQNGNRITQVVSSFDGSFSLTLPPSTASGPFDVEAEVEGFAKKVISGIHAEIGQAVRLNIVMDIGPQPPPPPPPADQRTFTTPVWNVWAERSASPPSFKPLPKLLVNSSYSLIVDLSALTYDSLAGVYSQAASKDLSQALEHGDPSATLDILSIPDEAYFVPLASNQRVQSMVVDLAQMRKLRTSGFRLEETSFNFLASHPVAPFLFGRMAIRINTRSKIGNGNIALSVWSDQRPVDELSIPLCIVQKETDNCSEAPAVTTSFRGVSTFAHGNYPSGALHLVELGSDLLVGIFRCNACAQETHRQYYTWRLDNSSAQLSRTLTSQIIPTFENALQLKNQADQEREFQKGGTALYNAIFSSDSETNAPKPAEDAFRLFLGSALAAHQQDPKKTWSLFLRLLPTNSDTVFSVPFDLMWAKFPDGTTDFLGRHVKVSTPLEIQDYMPPSACVSQWALFVPPASTDSQDALYAGLLAVSDSIKSFKKSPNQVAIFDGSDAITSFDTWLGRDIDDPKSYGLVTLSHHTQDRLCFDDELCPSTSVLAGDIKRGLTRPSIAILAGCGTARPGATEFIRKLNGHGVSAVIATSATVLAPMAGKFLAILIRLLKEHSSDTNYTIDQAKFEAVNELSRTPVADGSTITYGAPAFMFTFLGNGNLRLCTP